MSAMPNEKNSADGGAGTGQPRPLQPDPNRLHTLPTFDQFVRVLEDGAVNGDMSKALKEMAEKLTDYSQDYGAKKVTGSITLKLDFILEGAVFEINSKITEKHPEEPRGRTVLWTTDNNLFTPQNPRQRDMFGPRDAF